MAANPKVIRRQKELARQQKQAEKRRKKEERGGANASGDDDIAAIQAALDAGLNPGSVENRLGLDEGEESGGEDGSADE